MANNDFVQQQRLPLGGDANILRIVVSSASQFSEVSDMFRNSPSR